MPLPVRPMPGVPPAPENQPANLGAQTPGQQGGPPPGLMAQQPMPAPLSAAAPATSGLLRTAQQGGKSDPMEKKAASAAILMASQFVHKDPIASKKVALMLSHQPQVKSIVDVTMMILRVVKQKMGKVFPLQLTPGIGLKIAEMIMDMGISLKLIPQDPHLVGEVVAALTKAMMDNDGVHPQALARHVAMAHAKPTGKAAVAAVSGGPPPTTSPDSAGQIPSIAAGGV